MWPIDGIKEDKDRYNTEGGLIDQFAGNYGVQNWGSVDNLNAAAHAYTSAGLTLEWGATLADAAGWHKELFGSSASSHRDSVRDILNNGVGHQIGEYAISNNLPESVLDELTYDALKGAF